MEKPLKCFPLLSLTEMVLRRLAAILWNDSHILASIMRCPKRTVMRGDEEVWNPIVDEVKDKIIKLELPESLTKQMIGVYLPIGFEVRKWRDSVYFKIFDQNSAKLCFTTAGTVDYRRTAHELVRCDEIRVRSRYEMACLYWLEDCIPLLWQELEEVYKEYFYEKTSALEGLEFSWPRIFKDGQSNLDSYLRKSDRNLTSFNQWAFEHSAKEGYKETAEHFFRKLTDEERGASLMRSAHAVVSAVLVLDDEMGRLRDVLHYLLSLMTPEQQLEMVKAYPVQVMSCFLDWPRQDLFMENAGLIWPFIPPNLYRDLLLAFYDHDASHFAEIFKHSPLEFKQYALGADSLCYNFSIRFLVAVYDSKDSESIKLMFRTANVAERARLVSGDTVLRLFYDSMVRDDWGLVELCLREATLSGEYRTRLKEIFLQYLSSGFFWRDRVDSSCREIEVPQRNDRDPKLKRFFNFLDGTDASTEEEQKGQKRKLEDSSAE